MPSCVEDKLKLELHQSQLIAGAGDLPGDGDVDALISQVPGEVALLGHVQQSPGDRGCWTGHVRCAFAAACRSVLTRRMSFSLSRAAMVAASRTRPCSDAPSISRASRGWAGISRASGRSGVMPPFAEARRAWTGAARPRRWRVRGRFEPAEAARVGLAPLVDVEDRGAEVHALDLRGFEGFEVPVLGGRPDAEAAARCGAAGPAGALVAEARLIRRSSRRSMPRLRVIDGNARLAEINHRCTPSMVSEVSAMLVARITLRWGRLSSTLRLSIEGQ